MQLKGVIINPSNAVFLGQSTENIEKNALFDCLILPSMGNLITTLAELVLGYVAFESGFGSPIMTTQTERLP